MKISNSSHQNIQNKIKIIHLNIHSIRNKLDELFVVVEKEQPAFLCISEHWCTENEIKLMNIPGYRQSTYYCRKGSAHGGTAICTAENIPAVVAAGCFIQNK